MLYDALIAPFTEFEFMRRALAAVIALALGAAPIGVFLMLRRMSLVGDAMAHAILPGAAIGFLLSGLNLFAMTTGGLIAGFTVAILAGAGRAHHRAEGGRLARDLLSGVAGARRHHRFGQGHQYRSAACAVRQHPGDGRPDAAGDRLQRHHHAAGAGGDLSAAGDRMRRSGVPAHRQPRRRAGASGVPGAGRDQPRQRLSRARHAARRSG